MEKLYLNYDRLLKLIELTEAEQEHLKTGSSNAIERYLMKKFIHMYKEHNCGTQVTCYRWLNDFREIKGYKRWKSEGTVRKLWYVDFEDLNKEQIRL